MHRIPREYVVFFEGMAKGNIPKNFSIRLWAYDVMDAALSAGIKATNTYPGNDHKIVDIAPPMDLIAESSYKANNLIDAIMRTAKEHSGDSSGKTPSGK